MIEEFRSLGIEVVHGWGMTETSPVASVSRITPLQAGLDEAAHVARLLQQGKKLFGVDMRIVGEDGRTLPRDGKAVGELQVRGHWVCSAYLGEAPGSALDAEGWFSTGDVAIIHPDGTMQITDRKKDLIKSGGEGISSISKTRRPAIPKSPWPQ
jgi:fatty-acyl-CoA synthase